MSLCNDSDLLTDVKSKSQYTGRHAHIKSKDSDFTNFFGELTVWFKNPSQKNILFYIPYINSRLFGPVPAVFIFPSDIISCLHRAQREK